MKFSFAVVVVLIAVVVVRTLLLGSVPPASSTTPAIDFDVGAAARRLADALTYRIISLRNSTSGNASEFLRFHDFLKRSYPNVNRVLKRESVGGYSLLYTWQGTDPALEPAIMMAHMDVVPAAADADTSWTHPPFSGAMVRDYIWGRGAMDVKAALLGYLEAIEILIERGFRPRRTIYLAFGHDEEIGGRNGAAAIAALLQERNVQAAFTLDEGSAITTGIVPGVERPVALIALGEKGYMTFELTAFGDGGHTSRPPPWTAIARLSRAIYRLEQNPMAADLHPIAARALDGLAPAMPPTLRVAVANRWLLGPLVLKRLQANPATSALVRTTMVPVMLPATGIAENVIPREAKGVLNVRILPGDSVASVARHVSNVIADDKVTIHMTGEPREAPAVSDPESSSYKLLATTIRQTFPAALVVPSLVLGGTDSKHYTKVARDSLRFVPMRIHNDDIKRMHGRDERLAIADYEMMIRFYVQLFVNLNEHAR